MRAFSRFVRKKFALCVGLQESRGETKQMSTIRYDGVFLLYFCSFFPLLFTFFCGAVYRMIAVLCGPSDIQYNFFHSLPSDVMFFFTRYYPTLLFIDFLLHYS